MPSLSRDAAIARHDMISVTSYDVDLDLTRGSEVFGSTATIRFTSAEEGVSTFVEVAPRTLHSATLNGRELSVDDLDNGRLPLPGLASDNELTVVADMEYSHAGEGLHRFTDPEDGLTYTYMMGFLDMASRVFACFEQPDLKAPYRLTVTAPEDWTVVANEGGAQVSPGRWEFAETRPLATYFVTLVAGPYRSVYREHDGVRFGLHARRSYAEALESDTEELFEVTFGVWDRLHELYGVRYAFGDTYDQCFVPEFNAGAMENPGCVTFRDEAFMFRSAVTETQRQSRAETIAHEMAHMWFGDLVTLRWWEDLWLNESFADCMGIRGAVEGTRFTGGRAGRALRTLWGYSADQRPSTHPVAGTVNESGEALNNFDGISYTKGGAVLNQLEAWVGGDAYFEGLRDYFAKHRYGNASLADLMASLASASGRDLDDWSARWLRTCGPSTLRMDVDIVDGRYTRAEVVQTASSEHPTLRPHRLRLGLYRVESGRAVRGARITLDVDGERTPVPELIGADVCDLLLLNDENLTYAKIRLDENSVHNLPSVLPRVDDAMARALVWNMLADMVRDGELPVSVYLDVLEAALPHESLISQLDQQLTLARVNIDQYLSPGDRGGAAGRLEKLARRIGASAEPGGDAQLCALRAQVATSTDVEWLRALLDGRDVPDGVVVDEDLGWRIMLRLSVLGAASEADIAERLRLNPSSEGHKQASTCRVSRPDAEAKRTAWETVMTDRALSNHELRAVARGFWWPEQTELTAEYVARYFAEAPEGIGGRMPWEAMHLGHEMFPRFAVDADTQRAAEELAGREDLSPQLRRVVADDADDMRRALRVRGQ